MTPSFPSTPRQVTGWLIDLYPDETGLALWLLADTGERLSLRLDFPVTFYAAGEFAALRQAWRFLQGKGVSLARATRRDCSAERSQRSLFSGALKWLLVVCFGYLGYKNARFGKIESHEALTSISRELLLQAKETAESLGYTVLHMYIDCLWVQKPGCQSAADFAPLLATG